MIKKISQLNPLPLSAYEKEYEENLPWSEEIRKKYEDMLFEVSYQTVNADTDPDDGNEIDYYTSYNITLSGLDNALRLDDIRESLSNILCGSLSVISGDLIIGTPGDETRDKVSADGHYYYPDTDHTITAYSKFNLENNAEIHGTAEFHNDVDFRGETATLHVAGRSTFDQLINGVAYRAQWGDLAEYYSADEKYEPGTLVKFGGEKEITVATDKVNGVVTTQPGVILNGTDGMENPTGVALVGRVPIRIRGKVRKFDKIVLSHTDPGIGVVYNFAPYYETIGRALEENLDPGEKLVMCATRFNIG